MPAMMALINCCHKVAGAARSYALNLMALGKGGLDHYSICPKGRGLCCRSIGQAANFVLRRLESD